MSKQVKIWISIVIVIIIAIGTFFYLYEVKDEFFKELKNSFLGALVVVSATAIILSLQYFFEENIKKKQLIYEKKVDFFQKVANSFKGILKTRKINADDFYELYALRLEILLICGSKSFDNFNELLEIIKKNHLTSYSTTITELNGETERAIMKLFSSFSLELMEESNQKNNEQKAIKKILSNISNIDVINENINVIEKKDLYRTDNEKLEILIDFANSSKGDLPRLNETYGFKGNKIDIRGRVKLFRNTLLRKGYEMQLKQNGISIDPNVIPKIGSNTKIS